MNFLAHLALARAHSEATSFHLGAMLPDFLSMAELRLREVVDPVVASGVRFHRATDSAFHDGPAFGELLGEARRELASADVSVGCRRAATHVGIELLLDGWLARDAVLCASFHATLRSAPATDSRLFAHWELDGGHRRWSDFRTRLAGDGLPEGYADLDVLAARLERILARRPRLVLDAPARRVVRAWLRRARPRVEKRAEELLAPARRVAGPG